jgi:hypothetical protein
MTVKRMRDAAADSSERALNAKASKWARDTLEKFFTTDEVAFEPRTAAAVLDYLDCIESKPSAWRRLMRTETDTYVKRYDLCRSALESMARRKLLVRGTTTNALGNDRSATYARPRDAAADWVLEVDCLTQEQRDRAQGALLAWLSLEGADALDGVSGLIIKRRRTS